MNCWAVPVLQDVTKTYNTKDPFYRSVSKNIRLLEKYCVQKFGDFQKPTAMDEKCAFNIYITVPLTMVAGECSDTRITVPLHCLRIPKQALHHVSLNTHRRQQHRQSICPTPREACPKKSSHKYTIAEGCCRSSSFSHMPTRTLFQWIQVSESSMCFINGVINA